MSKHLFGKMPSGAEIYEYTLKEGELSVSVIPYGARITHFMLGDTDIMCGYDTLSDYLCDDSAQGALIGRFANRIRGGLFTLNGKTYQLEKNNNGKHHLHGGVGFARRVFTVVEESDTSLLLSYVSPDGEDGYPGTLTLFVRYTVKDGALLMEYEAKSDADTPLNLTNHAYFNLHGVTGETVCDHYVQIGADYVSEMDDDLIPSGKLIPVEKTAYDFRTPHTLGERMPERFGGYDNSYHLLPLAHETVGDYTLPLCVRVWCDHLQLDVLTDRPDMQLYTGNFLDGEPHFRGGVPRRKRGAVCLETHIPADAPNRGEGILRAGEIFKTVTAYRLKTC